MALALCNGRLGLAVSSCGVGGIHGESAVLKSPTCTVDLFFQPVNLAPVDIVVWQPGLHDQGQEPFHSICQCLQAMDGGPEKWFSVPPATTRKKDKLMLLKATVLDERGSTWQMQVTVRTRKAAAGPN